MAAIDKLYLKYYSDHKDFVIWCIQHKPSLLNNFYNPFITRNEWNKWQEEISKTELKKFPIANFRFKQDKYLYWHCPLDFVREYLENQCGYKKANWFVKLFWKYGI